MMRITFCAGALLLALPATLPAQSPDSARSVGAPDTAVKVTFGAFVDGYYAYDFDRPPAIDRAYTTQPARHNEFNINLAYVEAKVDGARVHGRLALQGGTSVQSNYAGEPTIGTVSGSSLSRHIQEAFAGYRVAGKLWIDGGIFFSHIGNETWISRDDWTYSRSFVWRTELRGFTARDQVFPDRSSSTPFSRNDGFIVTSLALTI